MDNVTHSLAGLLVAEGFWQARRAVQGTPTAETPGLRTVAALAAVVAANLPDIDVPYAALALDPLGSLLQHRGYTHTILAAAVGALLIWGAALVLGRQRVRRVDRGWLLGVIAVAVLSHLVLDWTNDYGVHPFWPVDETWHYGDAVFIIEPWLWVFAISTLLFATRRPALRVGLALVLAAGLAAAWAVSLVSWGAALALTIGAALALALALWLRPGARAVLGVAGWIAVELVFALGTHAARAQVLAAAALGAPAMGSATRVVDVVITPTPANPLCARTIALETVAATGGGRYQVTTGWAAALPRLLDARGCAPPASQFTPAPTLPMRTATRPGSAGVRWERTWDAPLAELRTLNRENCWANAVLRFARVPVWMPAGSDALLVEDLRYDRGGGAGFAAFRVPVRPTTCPPHVPPWRPPRADLLGADGAR